MTRIKELESKIIFLQETHLTAPERIQNRWAGRVIHAAYNNYARGVFILIHKTIPFQIFQTIHDSAWRYIIVQDNIFSLTVSLVSVYGPNEDKPKFFEDLFLTLSTLPGPYIIGGDFSCTSDPSLNCSTLSDTYKIQTRKVLKQYMADLNLVEIWRDQNPNKTEYSCNSG